MGRLYAGRLQNRGDVIDYQQEQETAIGYFRKAIDLQAVSDQEENLASSLVWLAYLYHLQGRYLEAEPLYLQALELRRLLLGENHPDVANSLNNLAGLYDSQGRYAEAEPLYLQALELWRSLLGESHPHVATSLNNLALLYRVSRTLRGGRTPLPASFETNGDRS